MTTTATQKIRLDKCTHNKCSIPVFVQGFLHVLKDLVLYEPVQMIFRKIAYFVQILATLTTGYDWMPYSSRLLHGLASQSGRFTGLIGWASTRRVMDKVGYKCYIVLLDLWDGGPTTLIHMEGHLGPPAPLELAAGVMSRPLHVWGTGWD
jgi:hypothetical protein